MAHSSRAAHIRRLESTFQTGHNKVTDGLAWLADGIRMTLCGV